MSVVPAKIRGAHVLFAMLAFFLTVIAVNVAFVVLALRTFPGEDVRRSYMQGLNYNATLAERRTQAALGWSAAAALVRADDTDLVQVWLRDEDGIPIEGALVSGALRWPTNARLDRDLVFEPRGDGRYVAAAPGLVSGQWVLRARAEQGESRALDFEAEMTWPPSP